MVRIKRPPLHENFDLPTRDELLQVQPGWHVKAIFHDPEIEEGISTERMWIIVEDISEDGHFMGTLSNCPAFVDMSHGDPVEVHHADVIGISEPE
jgi:uncharacterized protein YegJ (DUF2314 family)